MKIATMATGGIGGYLAVKLTQAGHQVATIARGAHLAAIQDKGLTLDGPNGVEIVRPWIATDDPAKVGPVDAVIFGVKGDGLPAAARACLPLLGAQTIVVPFLNGVEASDRLLEFLPAKNVGNGVARVSTTIRAPGVIGQVGAFASFICGERDSHPSDRIAALRAAIIAGGAEAPETDDVVRELWSKFVLFSGMSGVTAAARCTIGEVRNHAPLADLFRGVIAETAALGRVRGVALPDGLEAQIWRSIEGLPGDMRASTAIDLEHGRPLEIDWISGAVRRLAEQSGVPAPLNGALYALLLPCRDGKPGG